MASATGQKDQILSLLNQFYPDECEAPRLRVQLKASLFAAGLSIFDLPGMGPDDWAKFGVVGPRHVDLCQQLAALRPARSPRGPGAGTWPSTPGNRPTGLASASLSAGGAAAPTHGAAAAAGGPSGSGGRWGQPPAVAAPPPPPPTLPETRWESPTPRLQLIAARRPCDHHGVPDSSLWKFKPLTELEVMSEDLWDEKMVERALHSMHSVFSVPTQQHRVWHVAGATGIFWKGNPVDKDRHLLFVKGYWPHGKQNWVIEIGCLKCGYRSNNIYAWGVASKGVNLCRSGAQELGLVLDSLFNH